MSRPPAKTETVEEFLARGGVITPVPPKPSRLEDIPAEERAAMRGRCDPDFADKRRAQARMHNAAHRQRMKALADADVRASRKPARPKLTQPTTSTPPTGDSNP